jgi:hypothetical protein
VGFELRAFMLARQAGAPQLEPLHQPFSIFYPIIYDWYY